MAIQRLPLSNSSTDVTSEVILDSVVYVVRRIWQDRMSSWILQISLENGTVLYQGVRVSTGTPLDLGQVITDLYAGQLVATGEDPPPTIDKLVLFYAPADEIPDDTSELFTARKV